MKKLIGKLGIELANVFQDGTKSNDYFDGFAKALEIVKSYDPWIPIVELPPPIISLPMVSITVLLTDGVVITKGYYDYEVSEWVDMPNPAHWTFLPEVKK